MKKDFILVYENDDYAEMGGGTFFERMESVEILTDRVNELNEQIEDFSVIFAGQVFNEIKFEPVEIITKLKIKQ